MIRLGELDRTGVFERKVETGRTPLNEPIHGAGDVLRVKMRRRDVSDQERVSAGQESSAVMARFVVHSRPATRAIATTETFRCDDRTWSIKGIKEVAQGRNRFLELTAVSVDET